MAYAITRKHFLRLAAGFGATVTLGCGGDDAADDGADGDTAAGTASDGGLNTSTDGVDDGANTTDGGVTPTSADGMTDDGMTTDADGTTDDGTTDDGTTDDGMTDSSSGGNESTGAGVDCSEDPAVMIAGNHGHDFVVPAADVAAGVPVDYDIAGAAGHTHTVTLTAADFTELATTGTVMVVSTLTVHSHPVTVTC